MRTSLLLALAALLLVAGGLALGYQTVPTALPPNPIELEHGVPVGILDTPAGAVAAADNYVASEDDALLSRQGIRHVVDTVWAPTARAVELDQPLPAAALAGKPATFAGLSLTAAIAADRLVAYTRQTARVEVWAEITVWSASVVPIQRWTLDTVTLMWDAGRWLVAARAAATDSATPVPAWTSGGAADRTGRAFDARLAGMSAPYYRGSRP